MLTEKLRNVSLALGAALILGSALCYAAKSDEAKITVEFTKEELAAQMALNDAALKAIGGQAAKAFVILDEKYKAAQAPKQEAPK
jgi:hypothetical protein